MILRRSTTPDDPLRLATDGASGAAPGHLTPKASSLYRFRGYRDASSPAVYASRRASPHAMQDSLPARGLRLCRAGSRTRWIATRGLSSSHPPLQGFPWRNKRLAVSFATIQAYLPTPQRGRETFHVMLRTISLPLPQRGRGLGGRGPADHDVAAASSRRRLRAAAHPHLPDPPHRGSSRGRELQPHGFSHCGRICSNPRRTAAAHQMDSGPRAAYTRHQTSRGEP